MTEHVIFHCNRWIATEKIHQIEDYRGQKGVKALIYEGQCEGCKGPAYAYCKMDTWGNLTTEIAQVCRHLKPSIENELKTGKVIELPKDNGDDKQTRGGLRAGEYTMRITSAADNESLHQYLNFLASLKPIHRNVQQLQYG